MKYVPNSAFITLFLTALSACTTVIQIAVPDFRTSVVEHLKTVENRDYAGFKATLTSSNDLNVIFASGTMLENTQAVLDFHKSWFEDDKWIFKTNVVKVIEGTDQSTALVKYAFQDAANEPAREAWLVLTFQLEDNEWKLIHDQNTRITPKSP